MSLAPDARPVRRDVVVTYHYVRPENSDGVTGITPREFDAQLEAIGRSHRFVTVDEFAARAAGADPGRDPRPAVLVTFDDAVRDQYEHALPVLTRRAVPAVFFTPMRPVDPTLDPLNAWTPQHLLHALAQEMGWGDLESRVRREIGRLPINESHMHALYHYETPAKRWLKYALAFAIPASRAAETLNAINRGDVKPGPRLRASDWFMSCEELADLQSLGHALGGHGYDHLPYSTLSPLEQAWDMARASGLMNRQFGARPRAIAFPFGRRDEATDELARLFGYTLAFTTDDRVDCKFLEQAISGAEASMAAPLITNRERAA